MKLLFFAYEYPPLGGGTGQAVRNIFTEFTKREDLHIDFVTSSLENTFSKEQLFPNVTCYRIPIGEKEGRAMHSQTPMNMIRYTWHAFWLTWRLIRKNQYWFNHFFGFPGGLVSLLFKWRMPYIISLRGIDVPGHKQQYKRYYHIYKLMCRFIWKHAEVITANSRQLAETAKKEIPGTEMRIIINGVDTAKFKPCSVKQKFSTFTITAGGTKLIKGKGLRDLIHGFSRFHALVPNSELLLIGTGALEEELRLQAEELNVSDAVTLAGRQSQEWIAQRLPRCHVFCLPSQKEGMSNAALEALACGLPLVLTNVGGTKEMLRDNGFVIEKNNPADIAEKLEMLYKDTALREKMGRRSRKLAREFSWEKVAEEYLNIYKNLLQEK